MIIADIDSHYLDRVEKAQFLPRLGDYGGDDDASFPRLSRSISGVTGTVLLARRAVNSN